VSRARWSYPIRAFEAVGVELELMIVDRSTLSVRGLADRVLRSERGDPVAELERGQISWSNELPTHLIELKTTDPAPGLAGLADALLAEVRQLDALLEPHGARLMPTAMHPWMDPAREFQAWPHEGHEIYRVFDDLFGCARHGWANLQSLQLNLPFGDADEFARLHAAIRILLPLIPALSASSPFEEGAATGLLDNRMEHYRSNARRVPSLTGCVIPEPVFTREAYEGELLERLYADLAPLDPERALRHEWVNARGCIARFDRGAIEIRVIDSQECPQGDMAQAAAIIAVTRALTGSEAARHGRLAAWDSARLATLLLACTAQGDATPINDLAYLEALGLPRKPRRARDVWSELVSRHCTTDPAHAEWEPTLTLYADEGCLARRILARLGGDPRRERLHEVYADLCDCLHEGRLFRSQG
jgi:carboxylate-amine ligase